jgi:hypothetical protein
MNIIEFNEDERYVPNLIDVPEAWQNKSFKSLDFTGKEKLKNVLLDYLEEFNLDGCDSIVTYPSDFAYSVIISIYIEVSKRISADGYVFINWNDFVAKIQSFGWAADERFAEALFAKKFVFICDLSITDKYKQEQFIKILDYCYLNKAKLLVATRLNGLKLKEVIPEEYKGMYETKFIAVEIK